MTTRTPLRRDLADLKQKVYMLGEKCIEISELYNSLLENYSDNLENKLIDITNEIKKESIELNDQCFLVLTLQQPLIKDLRFVIGSLQIVLNLEKTSEQFSSTLPLITNVSILESTEKEQIIQMGKKVQEMLKSSLTLYLSANINSANDVSTSFSEVNYLHDLLYKQILKEVGSEKGQKAQVEAQLLGAIRSLEKVADLALSITEQVKYIIIGKSSLGQESS